MKEAPQHILNEMEGLMIVLRQELQGLGKELSNDDLRELAIKYAWKFIGTFYSWAGNSPMGGFDCSGLVNEITQSVGLTDRHTDYTGQGFYNKFVDKVVRKGYKGCFVFYGKGVDNITHIELCIDDLHSIGASGGGSKVITKEDAIKYNAFVKIRPFNSRKDIVAFVDPFLKNNL